MDGVTKDSVYVRLVMLAIIVTINVSSAYGEIIVEKSVIAAKMQPAIMQLDNAYAELVILDLAVKWSVRQEHGVKDVPVCVNATGQTRNPVILSMGNAFAKMDSLATNVPKTVQKVNGDRGASINAAAVVIHVII